MRKHITLHFYADPGHAWCKIPRRKLIELEIAHKVSSYSYARGIYAYLEEDCDASLLLKTLADHGIAFTIREHHTNKTSKIRNYPNYVRSF
jgi:hypothetical protein